MPDTSEVVTSEESSQNFTIEEARSVFSDEYDRIPSISDQVNLSESPFIWESGTIVPVWKAAARHSIYGREEGYVIPMLSSVRYYASNVNGSTPVRCDQNLIISKNINTGQISLSIVFTIPDGGMNLSHTSSELSCLLVYTDLSGKFRKIEKYVEGKLYDGVYFAETESKIAKERHHLFIDKIMGGVIIFKVNTLKIDTRCPAPGDTVEYNDSINPSYCNGNCYPDLWWQNPDFDFENDTTASMDSVGAGDYPWPDDNGAGGGGGGNYVGPPKNTGDGSDAKIIKPKDCSAFYGGPEYYKQRNADYQKRHKNNSVSNIYYMSYGLKYCEVFMDLKEEKNASEALKKWIDRTMVLLQEKLERLIHSNPTLEDHPESLMVAAFRTHPEAYIEGGLLQLSIKDKLEIISAIEYEDLVSKLGRQQVTEVVKAQINYYIKHPYERAFEAYYMMNNWDPIKQMLREYSFIDLPTRSSTSDSAIDRYNDLRDLLFEEIVNYFYDTVDGFEIDY